MNISTIMNRDVFTCGPDSSLNQAAQIMWDKDVGCVPVVEDGDRVVGMITDRDICMAVYTQGGTLDEHPVSSAMASRVHSCSPEDTIERAEEMMRLNQIRRLPVVEDGGLVGIVTMNDLALTADSVRGAAVSSGLGAGEVLKTLARICTHRPHERVAAE